MNNLHAGLRDFELYDFFLPLKDPGRPLTGHGLVIDRPLASDKPLTGH